MEVNKDNFKEQLLPILNHIANASYVSFDLEMSGITTRPRYSPSDRSHDIGKPSLQQQYDEIRAAAETFQVLQVGITCVEEDRERGELDIQQQSLQGHTLIIRRILPCPSLQFPYEPVVRWRC